MTTPPARLVPVSETCSMLHLASEIDVSLAHVIRKITQRIESECPGVVETTPSYGSILIETAKPVVHTKELLEIVRQEWLADRDTEGKHIELPAHYHPEVGPDLESLAASSGLSVEEVIRIHTSASYTVCAIGFAPGFAFLAEVDPRIAQPRHATPRAKVAAGSIGIAGQQTAVYPADSPGGWQIIGNCPAPLFDPNREPMCPFEVGDTVSFVPVDRDTFIRKGGHVG